MVPRPPKRNAFPVARWSLPGFNRHRDIAYFRKWYIEHHSGPPSPFVWKRSPPSADEVNDAVERYIKNGFNYRGYPLSNAGSW